MDVIGHYYVLIYFYIGIDIGESGDFIPDAYPKWRVNKLRGFGSTDYGREVGDGGWFSGGGQTSRLERLPQPSA